MAPSGLACQRTGLDPKRSFRFAKTINLHRGLGLGNPIVWTKRAAAKRRT